MMSCPFTSRLEMAILEAANRGKIVFFVQGELSAKICSDLTGETSEQQRERVARFVRKDLEQTKQDKIRRKQIKDSRRPYLARA